MTVHIICKVNINCKIVDLAPSYPLLWSVSRLSAAPVCPPSTPADFSNVISKSEIKALAEADEQEVVAEVQVRMQTDIEPTDIRLTDRGMEGCGERVIDG